MAVSGGSWLHPETDGNEQNNPGRHSSHPPAFRPQAHSGRAQYGWSHTAPSPPQGAGPQYRGISAGGEANQHNGHVYNSNSYYYTVRERRSDESLKGRQRSAALLKAAAEGQSPRVKHLLKLGADVDHADEHSGYTALHHAVTGGFEVIVEALLDAGSDVNAECKSYGTPLHLAALKGHLSIAQVLLRYYADVHIVGGCTGQPLHCALFYGNVEICSALLAHGAKVNHRANLHYGPMQAISLNAEHLAGVSTTFDCYPIDVAVDRENLDAVKLLLEKGASLTYSCQRWAPPSLYGQNMLPTGNLHYLSNVRPILRAASLESENILNLLLKNGASIHVEDDRGIDPVMCAAICGRTACLQVLLDRIKVEERAIAPDKKTVLFVAMISQDGFTALDLATFWSHTECVRILCAYMASDPHTLPFCSSALVIACQRDSLSIAEALLEYGSDVNTRDHKGYSPVLYAVSSFTYNFHLVLTLAERGADLEAVAKDGRSFAQSFFERSVSLEDKDFRSLLGLIVSRLYGGGPSHEKVVDETVENLKEVRARCVPGTKNLDQRMLHIAICLEKTVVAEVLFALGAGRGEKLLDIADSIQGTKFVQLYKITQVLAGLIAGSSFLKSKDDDGATTSVDSAEKARVAKLLADKWNRHGYRFDSTFSVPPPGADAPPQSQLRRFGNVESTAFPGKGSSTPLVDRTSDRRRESRRPASTRYP